MKFNDITQLEGFETFVIEYHKALTNDRAFPPLGALKALHTAASVFGFDSWHDMKKAVKASSEGESGSALLMARARLLTLDGDGSLNQYITTSDTETCSYILQAIDRYVYENNITLPELYQVNEEVGAGVVQGKQSADSFVKALSYSTRNPDVLGEFLSVVSGSRASASLSDVVVPLEKSRKTDSGVCKKCGSELDMEGYCEDETCAFSDWPQRVLLDDLYELSTDEVEKKYGVDKRSNP